MPENTPPYKRGVDIPKEVAAPLWEHLVEIGKDKFEGTAFVTGSDFKEEDVLALKSFYQEAYNQQKSLLKGDAVFNDSLMEHYHLAERYIDEIAPNTGINPFLLEAVILTHDFGRLFSHRRGRNNAIERRLTKILNFNKSFTELLPEDTLWTEVDSNSVRNRVNKLTSEKNGIAGIVEVIDVLAKWGNKDKTALRRWESVVESANNAQNSPVKEDMWPSEFSRQNKITSTEGKEATKLKYDLLKEWFEKTMDIKLDDLTDRVQTSLSENPLQQAWI